MITSELDAQWKQETQTTRIIIIHPNYSIFIAGDNRHLPIGEKEIGCGHANAVDILCKNHEFIRILLHNFCQCPAMNVREQSDLECDKPNTFNCISDEKQVLEHTQ
jgi:hypothetical protein